MHLVLEEVGFCLSLDVRNAVVATCTDDHTDLSRGGLLGLGDSHSDRVEVLLGEHSMHPPEVDQSLKELHDHSLLEADGRSLVGSFVSLEVGVGAFEVHPSD